MSLLLLPHAQRGDRLLRLTEGAAVLLAAQRRRRLQPPPVAHRAAAGVPAAGDRGPGAGRAADAVPRHLAE